MWPLRRCLPVLLAVVLGVAEGLILGDEGPPGSSPATSPVYFPVFPEDFKDFGIKVGGDPDVERGLKKLDMPVTTTKPTTTTDRLPINPDGVLSHVAPEAVTNPPGPSYLTDSYYYLDDHTPLPGSEELSLEDIVLDLPDLDRESEDQELQNLGPVAAPSFGKKMPLFALLDPLPFRTQSTSTGAPDTPTRPPSISTSAPVTPTRPPSISSSAPVTPTHTQSPSTRASKPPTRIPNPPTRTPNPPTRTSSPLIRTPSPPTRTPSPPTRTPSPPTRTFIKTLREPSTPTRAPSTAARPTARASRGPPVRTTTTTTTTTYASRRTTAPPTTLPPARRGSRPSNHATTNAPPTTPASPFPHKSLKLRPAFTPIPTPAPTSLTAVRGPSSLSQVLANAKPSRTSRPSSRTPSQALARVPTSTPVTTKPSTVRLLTARPKFESSRLRAKSKNTATRPTPAPTPIYRTPTPPTTTTTISSRGYGRRTSATPAPRRQHLSVRDRIEESPVYRTSTKAYRAPSSLFHVRGSTTTVTAPAQPDFVQSDPNIYVPVEYDEDAIPGEAGIDYPNYQIVPDTPFTCDAQEHPGLYADTDSQCQTFHICQEDGRQNSFLCPNGTVFNQQYFVCDWWYNFSCDHALRFYSLNAFIYELPDAGKYAKK